MLYIFAIICSIAFYFAVIIVHLVLYREIFSLLLHTNCGWFLYSSPFPCWTFISRFCEGLFFFCLVLFACINKAVVSFLVQYIFAYLCPYIFWRMNFTCRIAGQKFHSESLCQIGSLKLCRFEFLPIICWGASFSTHQSLQTFSLMCTGMVSNVWIFISLVVTVPIFLIFVILYKNCLLISLLLLLLHIFFLLMYKSSFYTMGICLLLYMSLLIYHVFLLYSIFYHIKYGKIF